MTDNDPFLEELQQRADSAHRSVDRADDVPQELWQRVLSQAKPKSKEIPTMSSVTMPSRPFVSGQSPEPEPRGGFRHYANLAATIAIVIGVALAGWFATMQLNQPPVEPRFAAMGIQREEAGNGVCDVEPLTVDEALYIVKDPLGSLVPDIEDPAAEGTPETRDEPRTITVPNVYWYMSRVYEFEDYGISISDGDFEEAGPVVDEYLDCLKAGSQGQVWRLMNPITVQAEIVMMLPVFSSEVSARQFLPALLDSPAIFNIAGSGEIRQLKRNPNQTQTEYMAANSFMGFSEFAISPVIYLDEDGNVLIEADVFGSSIEEPDRDADGSMNVIYGRSSVDNEWYVIDFFYPFTLPGWD